MYSLTEATDLLLKSAKLGLGDTIEKSILSYNSHKIRHTLGVLEVGRQIIIKLKEKQNLSDNIINKSEICFILHDLGRFYQNNGTRIFKNDEFNHGEKSYQLTKENKYDDSICLAIRYHDKYSADGIFEEADYISMTDSEKEETVFLSKFLRDSDKLQNMLYSIFNIEHLSKIDVYSEGLTNSDISEININAVKKHILIDRNEIRSHGDYILSSLCFIFDINFRETIEILKFFGYFDRIYVLLENNPGVSKENLEIIKKEILNFKI